MQGETDVGAVSGDRLREAVLWMSARREENPELSRVLLIDEAALRFRLGAADVRFLVDHWKPAPA